MRFIPLKFLNFCAACVAFLSGVESGRILCFFSVPSISHQLVFQPIWKSLALRGHELIVVTPDPLNDPTLTNLREINVNDSYEIFNRMNLHEAMSADKTMAQQLYHGMSAVLAITEHQLNNPQFKKILDDPGEKFDLIMYESLSPVLIGLSYRFAAPIIGVSSLAPPVNVHEMVGNPSHPLLHFGLGVLQTFQPETGFSERLFRTWCSLYYRLFTHFYTLPESDAIARRHFGEGMPHLGELQRRVDMVFAGSNPFVDGFRPTVPAYVDLRFVHLRQKHPLNKCVSVVLEMRGLLKFWVLNFLGGVCGAARIFGFFSFPCVSHQVGTQQVWKELSLRGHQVVVATPFPLNDPSLTNLTEIDLGDSLKFLSNGQLHTELMDEKSPLQQTYTALNIAGEAIENQFNNAELKKLLHNKSERFDAVLVEAVHPVLTGFSHRFKAPLIGFFSFTLFANCYDAVGNPSSPAVFPEFALGYHGRLSFWQRFYSAYYWAFFRWFHHFSLLPRSDAVARKYFGNDMPYVGDLENGYEVLVSHTNPLLHPIRPTVPALIETWFTHIRAPKKLPTDLQVILDEAKEGVIYFSLGSNVKSVNLDEELKKTIKEALAELPYKIIFKWESDQMPGKPDNVITRKWLPQQDLLGHPNVKAFVTQGGLQSLEEAIVNAVPIVGVPFFADQPMNVGQAVKHGFGIHLDPKTVTKNELKEAITQVAENKKYREKIKELRDVLLDQPMTGVEKAVWWTEYVIRHKGAKHLRSATLDIPWYQYFLLDVFAAILAAILVAVYVIFKIAKLLVGFSLRQKVKVKSA